MPTLVTWLRTFGLDAKRGLAAVGGIARYREDRRRFRAGLDDSFTWGREMPMLEEWSASSGGLGAYFHQDLRVAGWIHQAGPRRHVDVGSRLDGFIGHLAVFREVEVLDIRPQPIEIPNILFRQLDLMEELPPEWTRCTDSLSCLHTIEHFGLGRYGDPIDPQGHVKGIAQLKRMVEPGGIFYLSTPIGPQRVEFNAHRIFGARTVLDWFKDGWTIEKFSFLDDSETMHNDVDLAVADIDNHFGCRTGLAMVAARKNA